MPTIKSFLHTSLQIGVLEATTSFALFSNKVKEYTYVSITTNHRQTQKDAQASSPAEWGSRGSCPGWCRIDLYFSQKRSTCGQRNKCYCSVCRLNMELYNLQVYFQGSSRVSSTQ